MEKSHQEDQAGNEDGNESKKRKRHKNKKGPTVKKVPAIHTSAMTRPVMDRFFAPGKITYTNVKPGPPLEASGETTLEILTDVLTAMQPCDMITTPAEVEKIMQEHFITHVTERCDDMGKWMDHILSKVTFDKTGGQEKTFHEKLLKICCSVIVKKNNEDQMMESTRNIFADNLVRLLYEMVHPTKKNLHVMWQNFWKNVISLTLNRDALRNWVQDNGLCSFEVDLLGKSAVQDFVTFDAGGDEYSDADDESSPPMSFVKACFISEPDLIISADFPDLDEYSDLHQDVCVVEIKTSRICDSTGREIWESTEQESSTSKINSASGRKNTESPWIHNTKLNEINSRYNQIDKQHFLQLFSCMKLSAQNDSSKTALRMFGLYIVMHKVYPTALTIKNLKPGNIFQKVMSACNFLNQDSYISFPPTSLDENNNVHMVAGPHFNLFKPGHLRALLAYISILIEYEYMYMDQVKC